MPRRAIIIMLVVLIVGILGGTVALFLNRIQNDSLAQATPSTNVAPGTCDSTDPTLDADSDGLSNGDEKLWGSNPCNPDTDGDTFLDGAEVKNGHNPTIASPNDILPAGFIPGRGVVQPNAGGTTIPTPTPTADTRNFTTLYSQQVKSSDQTDDTLAKFVDDQPVDTNLPTIADATLTILPNNDNAALSRYLDVINAQIELLQPEEGHLDLATSNLQTYSDSSQAQYLGQALQDFSKTLHGTPVPPVAVSFQQFFIGYVEKLTAVLNDSVQANENDHVRALVDVRQLLALQAQHWPTFQQEYIRLNQILNQ